MINQQELKHKMKSNRNNNSNNSLLSMKDYKKPAVSRQKSKNKNTEQREEYDGQISKPKSFKGMVDNAALDNANKSNLEVKSKSLLGKPMHEHPRGISINVNIQNVITPKNLQNITTGSNQHDPTPKIDRNLNIINQDSKKSRKVSKLRPDPDDFDFQCTEELNYHSKKPTASKSDNTKQKYIERPITLQNISTCSKQKNDHSKFSNRPKASQIINVDPKQQLDKFYKESVQIKANADYEAMIYLDARQSAYMVRPDYIEKKQKNFTWLMRAVVVEWIMQVSYEFSLKRETFYQTINIVDRFLEKQTHLLKSDFQLVGAAAMLIASKLQQFQQKSIEQFVKTANGSYSAKQIKQMEKKIVKVLKYQLNPPTLFRWANLLMVQWDGYLKQNIYAQRHPLFALRDQFYFKQLDEDAYLHFRQLVQLIDCSILEVKTYEYNPKLLVCSFMYLMIGKQMEIFSEKQIPSFQNHSFYLIDEENLLNDLFESFLEFTFGIKLRQLLPIVQYCSSFFALPPNFQQPLVPNAEQAQQNMQLQQYCSFQTFDKNMLIIIKKRNRGIYLDRNLP